MWTVNFQMFKLDLEKAEEPEIKLPASVGLLKKQENSRKTIYFCLVDYAKAIDCVDCDKLWKILRREYQRPLHAFWEICVQIKKKELEPDMKQWTGSKLGKEYIKAVYCLHAYLTFIQSISWEILDWVKHKLESRLLRSISITLDTQMIPHLWLKVKRI